MHLSIIAGWLSLVRGIIAHMPLSKRQYGPDENTLYVQGLCYPLLSNSSRISDLNLTLESQITSLSESPFPCEQVLYLGQVCTANGTETTDFQAEQDCLCGSSYWAASEACTNCYFVHGFPNITMADETSYISSLSLAECTPSPPIQAFSNYLPVLTLSDLWNQPPITLGDDQFPNQTEISDYWTSTVPFCIGQITGSATARLTSWTNTEGVRYTPTATMTSAPAATITSAAPSHSSSGVAHMNDAGKLFGLVAGAMAIVL